MKMFVRGAMIGLLFASFSQAASVGPTPYLSAADSPWNSVSFSSFFLEDFEDGLLNTPDVSQAGATDVPAAGGQFNDSVDSDDGAIDGFGTAGRSHYTTSGTAGITYTFGTSVSGGLPTHAGVVWTDLSGTADVFLEAFDQNNLSLGILAAGALNDGVSTGETAEDRFLGWEYLGGISSIRVYQSASDMELDHLQYGVAVPEPTTIGLALAAMVLCFRRRT
jgi:hypothetical protein